MNLRDIFLESLSKEGAANFRFRSNRRDKVRRYLRVPSASSLYDPDSFLSNYWLDLEFVTIDSCW